MFFSAKESFPKGIIFMVNDARNFMFPQNRIEKIFLKNKLQVILASHFY